MESAVHEMPLVIFSTLAPIGAGAFVPLFLLFLRSVYRKPSTTRIDQLTLVPILFAFVGFFCSFFHLGNPSNVLNVLQTVGQTPLANEVVAFAVFLALALVYWIIVVLKKWVSSEIRMIMSGIVMVSGLVAVIFMGMAYFIPTMPVWDAPHTVMNVLGVWLFGGSGLGIFLISIADPRDNNSYADELTAKVLFGVGGLLLLASSISIFMVGSAVNSAVINTSQNADGLLLVLNISQIATVLAIVAAFLGRKRLTRPMFIAVFVLSFIACLLSRICFYGMEISIGL